MLVCIMKLTFKQLLTVTINYLVHKSQEKSKQLYRIQTGVLRLLVLSNEYQLSQNQRHLIHLLLPFCLGNYH